MTKQVVELLALIEVAQNKKVLCQADKCGKSVYKRVHIVRDDGSVKVFGSTCFSKVFGEAEISPKFGGNAGRLLSEVERELLLTNTKALLKRFAEESDKASIIANENVIESKPVTRCPSSARERGLMSLAKQFVDMEFRTNHIDPTSEGSKVKYDLEVDKRYKEMLNDSSMGY